MITRQAIIEQARKDGIRINKAYCRRLEDKRLIPRAEIKRLGRNKGTAAYYPDGTYQRIVKIIGLRHNHFSYDYDGQIPLAIWNMGYEVDILPLFEKSLGEYKASVDQLRGRYEPEDKPYRPDDAADRTSIFSEIATKRLSDFEPQFRKFIGQIRKWVGKKNMPATLEIISWAVTDPETSSLDEDEKYDQHAFVSPMVQALKNIATIPSIRELMANIRGYIDPDNLDELLHQRPDEISRQEYLLQGYREMNNAMTVLSIVTGWKMFFPEMSAEMQCIFTLAWLSFRQNPKLREGYEQIMKHKELIEKHQQELATNAQVNRGGKKS